jgi:hypothetical protein
VLPFPDLTLKFSMVEPKGGGDRLFDHLMPRVSDVAERVADAIAHGESRAGATAPASSTAASRCACSPAASASSATSSTHRYRTMIEVGEPDYFPVDDLNKRHPPACAGCHLRGPCPGLYHRYHEVHGDAELRPRPGPRANAFNYTLTTLALPVPEDMSETTCPLRDGPLGVTPWDRGRDLFVRHAASSPHRADTRDFSDAEIADIKHTRGQVYLDASRKPAPDDFARDLVPLRPRRACAPAARTSPPAPASTNLSSRTSSPATTPIVRAHLASLTGDLLDLGCGAHAVVRRAAAAGLAVLDHHPVGPATSNQWAVRLRAP